MTTSFKN